MALTQSLAVDTTPLTKKQCPLSGATMMEEGKSWVEYSLQ
jgi:hypothetical protein